MTTVLGHTNAASTSCSKFAAGDLSEQRENTACLDPPPKDESSDVCPISRNLVHSGMPNCDRSAIHNILSQNNSLNEPAQSKFDEIVRGPYFDSVSGLLVSLN